jgi:tetratricopeptide (TPR) repeat protein
MALLISVVGSVIGTLIVAPVTWLWNKIGGRHTVQAGDRSVASGGDQTIEGPVSTGNTVAETAEIVAGPGSVIHVHREEIGDKRGAQLDRMEAMLTELKEGVLAPPQGASSPDTEALAAEATSGTERLLAEAIELQRQHKEREAIERLLTAYDMDMPPTAKADLHILAGNGFLRLSELEEAEGHYRQALDASGQASDKAGQAAALGSLGIVYAERGALDKAEKHMRDALRIYEEMGSDHGQAMEFGNLGVVYARRADLDEAKVHHKRALAIYREIGNRLNEAHQLANLGTVYGRRGDLEEAEEHIKDALAIYEEVGERHGQAAALGNLGSIYMLRGDLDKAEEHHEKSLAINQAIGDRLRQAECHGNLATVYKKRGDVKKAEERYQKALGLFEEIGADGHVAQTRRNIDRLRAREG